MNTIIVLLIINFINFSICDPIELRGVVEGFYGTPWTFEHRADIVTFESKNNLNSYIYAPKDDPYHREDWRIPYPDDIIQQLQNLISTATQNSVKFIFAVSPGLDLDYDSEDDFNALMAKLDSLYQVGCRYFAIFFDDITAEPGDGKKQALFLNKLQDALDTKYSDSNPLITVPTQYCIQHMIDDQGNVKEYTQDMVNYLDEKITVLYTGDRVVSDGISDESYKMATDIYKRSLGIWWNYPVNDYLPMKLALGPIEKLPTANVKSIFYNPMGQVQLSKICLATGGDYAMSPDTYDPLTSWDNAIKAQFGDLAPAMKVFATHSRHMEKSDTIKCGPADAPEFYEEGHQAVLDYQAQIPHDYTLLQDLLDEMQTSYNTLMNELQEDLLAECLVQLQQFLRIIFTDKVALKSLKEQMLDARLVDLRNEIASFESVARVSELSAVKFIDEVIELFGGK